MPPSSIDILLLIIVIPENLLTPSIASQVSRQPLLPLVISPSTLLSEHIVRLHALDVSHYIDAWRNMVGKRAKLAILVPIDKPRRSSYAEQAMARHCMFVDFLNLGARHDDGV